MFTFPRGWSAIGPRRRGRGATRFERDRQGPVRWVPRAPGTVRSSSGRHTSASDGTVCVAAPPRGERPWPLRGASRAAARRKRAHECVGGVWAEQRRRGGRRVGGGRRSNNSRRRGGRSCCSGSCRCGGRIAGPA